MRSRKVSVAALLAVLGTGTAWAGDRTPAVSAEVVRLDVAVSDAKGQSVRGLTREDFEVRENGKLQTLTDFVFLAGQTERPVSAPAAPQAAEKTAAEKTTVVGDWRRIVLIVDELHLTRAHLEPMRTTLRRFVEEVAAPEDVIALVTTSSRESNVQMTRDRSSLEQAINGIRARADELSTGDGAQLTPEQAEQIVLGDPVALKLGAQLRLKEAGSISATQPGAGLGPVGDTVPGARPSRDPVPLGIEKSDKSAATKVQGEARVILAEALFRTDASLETVAGVLRGMAQLPGRRLCVLVSDGFVLGTGTAQEQVLELRRLMDAATRSGVAVQVLASEGVEAASADASAPGRTPPPPGLGEQVARRAEQQRRESLERVADQTGGVFVRGADSLQKLGRILRQDVYLLAYEPHNKRRRGRFRKISVRVHGRPDLTVRTRKGYFEPSGK